MRINILQCVIKLNCIFKSCKPHNICSKVEQAATRRGINALIIGHCQMVCQPDTLYTDLCHNTLLGYFKVPRGIGQSPRYPLNRAVRQFIAVLVIDRLSAFQILPNALRILWVISSLSINQRKLKFLLWNFRGQEVNLFCRGAARNIIGSQSAYQTVNQRKQPCPTVRYA